MALARLFAVFGTSRREIPAVLQRAYAMLNGMSTHVADYPAPSLALPAFQTLIDNAVAAEKAVPWRTIGAAAMRDEQRDLLWTGMVMERTYVQSLADQDRARGASLILNAGLLIAKTAVHDKPLLKLKLKLGKEPGTVGCVANLGLLVGTGTLRPNQKSLLQWEYTVDGGATILAVPPTPGCRTVIGKLPRLAEVGVRVSMTNMSGPGAWSAWATITVV